jgi:gliding motility-associated-like protein
VPCGFRQTTTTDITDNIYKANIKPDKSGVYNFSIVSLSDGNGCVAQAKTGSGKLTVFTKPKAFAGNDTSVCGLIANLAAIPSVGKGQWSTYFNTEFTSGYASANQQIKVPDYGKYAYTWKENNGGCIDEDSVNITFYYQPTTVDAGENLKGNYLFNTVLKAEPVLKGTGIGKWSSTDESIVFENDTIPNTYVSNLKFGDNVLVWTITNGVCNAIKDSIVISTGDIRVPNGFSPNNDRVNDKFEIIGLDQVKDANLVILNKWGLKVFESGDYKNDWDGTYKGNNLPEDSYFYILNVIGRTYKGVVTIRR